MPCLSPTQGIGTVCTKVARIFLWLSFQTCAYDSGAVMITKLESFETSLQQIESIMGKSKFTEVRKSSLFYTHALWFIRVSISSDIIPT